jgi:ankyrin repeat protein
MLQIAAYEGYEKLVSLLLERGADVEAKDEVTGIWNDSVFCSSFVYRSFETFFSFAILFTAASLPFCTQFDGINAVLILHVFSVFHFRTEKRLSTVPIHQRSRSSSGRPKRDSIAHDLPYATPLHRVLKTTGQLTH